MSFGQFFKYFGIFLLSLLTIYFLFLYFSYLDETITEGEGFGFTIGMTKDEVFEAARKEFKGKDIVVEYTINESGSVDSFVNNKLTDIDFKDLRARDFWALYFNDNSSNSVKFTFQNNFLVKIQRHRQYFEII